jgi:hypothetical protein
MSLPSRHGKLVRHLVALAVFCVASLTWFHGVAAHPGSQIPCCASDGTSNIRDLWLDAHLHESPWTLKHDPFDGAPEGLPRSPATVVAASGAQIAFMWWTRGLLGLTGAANLLGFVGLVGTGMATFALLDWLGCTFAASLFGAYAFGFSPYAFARLYFGHLGLMQNWIFVVAVAAMLYLRSRRTYGRAALAGLAVALGFYLSAYQGLFAGLIVAAFYVVELVRGHGRSARSRTIALASASFWTTVIALAPILVFYERERSTVSGALGHKIGDLYGFAARMGGYFLPSPLNPLFRWVKGIHPADLNEQSNFIGYSTIALAIFAVVLVQRREWWLRDWDSRWVTALAMTLLAPAAFLLSLPPAYHPAGLTIPTPSALLGDVTTFWRVFARFGVVVGFALAVLAAFGLSALTRRPGRWRLLGPVALFVLFLELVPGNVGTFATGGSAVPGWVTWLASRPAGTVATYPIDRGWGPTNQFALESFYWQTVDRDPGFSLVNMNYDQFLSRQQSIRLLASDLENPLAARILATEGVKYVVLDPATYRSIGQPVPRLDLRHFTLLHRDGPVRIYSVHAPKIDISRAIRASQGKLEALRGLAAPVSGRLGRSR